MLRLSVCFCFLFSCFATRREKRGFKVPSGPVRARLLESKANKGHKEEHQQIRKSSHECLAPVADTMEDLISHSRTSPDHYCTTASNDPNLLLFFLTPSTFAPSPLTFSRFWSNTPSLLVQKLVLEHHSTTFGPKASFGATLHHVLPKSVLWSNTPSLLV